MTTVSITISSDLSTLGHNATAEDLDNYMTNLARLISSEFGCGAEVTADSVGATSVRCSDSDLRDAVAERIADIESSDEWARLIVAPVSDEQIDNLSTEAAEAGDLDQVALCERAIAGDAAARSACERVIRNAQANLSAAPDTERPSVVYDDIVDPSHHELVDDENNVLEPAAGDYGSKDYYAAVSESLECEQPEGWVNSARYGRVYAQRCN